MSLLLFNTNTPSIYVCVLKSLINFLDTQDLHCNEHEIQNKYNLKISALSLINSLINCGPGEVRLILNMEKNEA